MFERLREAINAAIPPAADPLSRYAAPTIKISGEAQGITMRIATLAIVLTLAHIGMAAAQIPDEAAAIEQTVLDYVDGWWSGDAVRMERSLHPDLVKRITFRHETTGRSLMNSISKTDMVEFTRAGGGSDSPDDKGEVEVSITRIDGDIATVVATSAKYVDYLHLAKWNGRWVIVNVLWGMR